MEKIVKNLQMNGFSLCSIYILDSTFITDDTKFISGVLITLASMLNLSLPHLTILSKCDLIEDKSLIEK